MTKHPLRRAVTLLACASSATCLVLSLAGGFGVAAAQSSSADSALDACLAADTTRGWQEMAHAWNNESRLTWSNDSLRQVLLVLVDRDQAVRPAGQLADSMAAADFRRRMHATDSADAAVLSDIIDRFGWPTRSMVGPKGASAAFVITQHNPSLQHRVLALVQALPASEVSVGERAMLEDRVRVREGLPQRFGTQASWDSTGVMRFDPIEDIEHLDVRRVEVGLPPMPVYLCMLQAIYGRKPAWPPPSKESRSGS